MPHLRVICDQMPLIEVPRNCSQHGIFKIEKKIDHFNTVRHKSIVVRKKQTARNNERYVN